MDTKDWLFLSLFLRLLSGNQMQDNYSLVETFNCTSGGDTRTLNLNNTGIKKISLLSPCHPGSDSSCQTHSTCTITFLDIAANMWVELSADGELSDASDDLIKISWDGAEYSMADLIKGFRFYSGATDHNSLSVTLSLKSSAESQEDLWSGFRLEIIFAYILGKSYSSTGTAVVDNPGKGGYIVSHDQYDRVSDSDNNYYNDGQVQELTLTRLHQKEVIRITFLKFDLHKSFNIFYSFCDDYLEITNIRARDIYFCGHDDPTDMPTEVYASNKSVTFRFMTRKIFAETSSAGFLIKYEVIRQNKNECPPTIQNTQKPVSIDDVSGTFDIKCSPGYWIDSQTYAQTVNCSTNWREYLMSCTVIECPIQLLANLSSNFTLDQTGRATIGTKATYFSSDLPTRYGTATCMSNGQWNITDFEFLPIDETSLATDSAETTVFTTSGSKTADVSKSSSTNVSIYVGVIVGIIVVAALTVLLVCLLRRRRTRFKSNRPALPPPAASPCPEKSKIPQATDETVYSLADELPSAAQTPDTRAQNEVYELAVNPVTSKENESGSFLTAETTDPHGLVYSLAGEEQTSLINSVEPNDSTYYEYPRAEPTKKGLVSRLTERTPDDGNSSFSPQSPTAAEQDQQTISMVDNELYGS